MKSKKKDRNILEGCGIVYIWLLNKNLFVVALIIEVNDLIKPSLHFFYFILHHWNTNHQNFDFWSCDWTVYLHFMTNEITERVD